MKLGWVILIKAAILAVLPYVGYVLGKRSMKGISKGKDEGESVMAPD